MENLKTLVMVIVLNAKHSFGGTIAVSVKTKYYIVFNAPDGVTPQKGIEYNTKEEAQKVADSWNEGRDTTYGGYEVREKLVCYDGRTK